MDKKKEIEEIQKVIEYCCNVYDEKNRHIRNKCNTYDCQYYDETNGLCCSFGLKEATVLYNAGYRKIDKDSVVLTREEYEKYMEFKKRVDGANFFEIIKNERKEMAEKFYYKVMSFIGSNQKFWLVDNEPINIIYVDKLFVFVVETAKIFGVEIKE